MWQCPLNQRVYKSRLVQARITEERAEESHHLHKSSSNLKNDAKAKRWHPESMEKALKAVLNGDCSIRVAAETYDVPKSTLGDWICGRVLPGSMSGPQRLLDHGEEEELVQFIRRFASIGYPKSRKDIIAIVENIIQGKGQSRTVSNGWWECFCKRHPDLTLRTPVPLSQARAKATDGEVMDSYFNLLEKTLDEYELREKPSQIFNMDESGFPLSPKPLKGMFEVGTKNAATVTSGDKAQITVLACISAAGYCLPPMVIWDRKILTPELTNGEIPGTIYGLSKSGWIDQELFDKWFTHHFLHYAPASRPLLLLMDGHSSHLYPQTIYRAAKDQVILFVLPPNTTHISQPLDKGCFGPLKMKWAEVCHDYIRDNPGKVVTRFVFSKLLHQAWTAMSFNNITTGFRITGIYPVNRNAIGVIAKKPASPKPTGMKFLPLCSPTPHTQALQVAKEVPVFTQQEFEDFEKKYEEESAKSNVRYNQWREMYHPLSTEANPTESATGNKVLIPAPGTINAKLFPDLLPPPKSTRGTAEKPKPSGRVLTSDENIKILKEKQENKQKEIELKEEKKRQREERNKMKQSATVNLKRPKGKAGTKSTNMDKGIQDLYSIHINMWYHC